MNIAASTILGSDTVQFTGPLTILDGVLISLSQWEIFKATETFIPGKGCLLLKALDLRPDSVFQFPLPLFCHSSEGTGRLA